MQSEYKQLYSNCKLRIKCCNSRCKKGLKPLPPDRVDFCGLGQTYCQIYCQKRGGEGIQGDGELHVFSNLLISIYLYVDSNPTLSAT